MAMPTESPCSLLLLSLPMARPALTVLRRMLLVIVSGKTLAKINGHTFFSTGPSLRTPHQQMSRDYPIPVETHGICFCLGVCFTPSKMSSIFRQDRDEILTESTAQNTHQHTGSLPLWQQVMLHPTRPLLQCGTALSAPQYCILYVAVSTICDLSSPYVTLWLCLDPACQLFCQGTENAEYHIALFHEHVGLA